jgi:phenylalanine-4-hydroxylase
LIDPDYRAFLSGFGAASLELMDVPGADRRLGLAFKWSIEYGLIAYDGEIRACGAGLMSSAGELAHALGPDVRRLRFDPALASTTHHVPAQLQPRYFVLDSFAALHDQLPDLIRCATAPEPS